MKKKRMVKIAVYLVLALVMLLSMSQIAFAAETNFPLYSWVVAGETPFMIADLNTRYITEFAQDPVTSMVTATVIIENGNTTTPISFSGVVVEVSFKGLAPYQYDPTVTSDPHEYNAARMFLNSGPVASDSTFERYCYRPVTGFKTVGGTIMYNSSTGGYIGGRISATGNDGISKVTVPPASKLVVAQLFFMPISNGDILTSSMVDYKLEEYEYVFKQATPCIGDGPCFVLGVRGFNGVRDYVISPSTFKIHFVQNAPTGLTAVNFPVADRRINGYNTSTMEWSYDNITFSSTPPTIKDEAHTIYVRLKETAYSGSDAIYGAYKKFLASASVPVVFDKSFISCKDSVTLTKTSRNMTSSDGKLHVNDRISYTIVASNEAGHPLSVWTDAVMTDRLVDGVTFAGNVTLDGTPLTSSGYTYAGGVLTVPLGDIPGTTKKTVSFEVTVNADAYGKNITNSVTVAGKDGKDGDGLTKDKDNGGETPVVTSRSAAPTINPVTEGDKTISGTGVPNAPGATDVNTVTVTLPDGTKLGPVPVGTDGKWSVDVPTGKTLPAGQKVTAVQNEPNKEPSAPLEVTILARPDPVGEMVKTSENQDRNDGRQVNDRLRYTIVVRNKGDAKSLWQSVVVEDTLPSELTFGGLSTVMIDGSPAGSAATLTGNVLKINLGDIPGGESKMITFEAVINESAAGKVIKNSAKVGDLVTSEPDTDPVKGRSPIPTVDEVNEGDKFITGTGDTSGQKSIITVSYPNSTLTSTAQVEPNGTWKVEVPKSIYLEQGKEVTVEQTVTDNQGIEQYKSEPVKATINGKKPVDPFMEKTVTNLTSADTKTRVGDTLLYTVTIENKGSPKSYWTNAVMTDVIPAGLTLDTGSVLLNGQSPTFTSYTASTRTLSVTVWSESIQSGIQGGTKVEITFKVIVNADAYGKHIKNSASVAGKENDSSNPITGGTEETGGGYDVTDKSAKPYVDPITREDDKITGTGEPDATIVVTLPDGGAPITTKVKPDGTWEANVPNGREPDTGDEVKVVQTEGDKDPSEPVIVIVIDKNYRGVHGYVWPMATDNLNTPGFLEKHAIVVELRPTFKTPATGNMKTTAVLINANGDGEFTINKVPFGTYVLYIKRPGFLVRAMMVTISSTDPDMMELTPPNTGGDNGVFNLWWGDCNEDYSVDNFDVMLILSQMSNGVHANHVDYDPACDMNADGRPDNGDIMLVLNNWSRFIRQYAGGANVDYYT